MVSVAWARVMSSRTLRRARSRRRSPPEHHGTSRIAGLKAVEGHADESAPRITKQKLDELSARLAALSGRPRREPGAVSICPDCGGRMVVTNDLERASASAGRVFIVARLPGARCENCGASQLDGSGVGIMESLVPRETVANYVTSVTHSRGTTLGTRFKTDLARVLRLSGSERLSWKVLDRDQALVQVKRTSRSGRSTPAHTPPDSESGGETGARKRRSKRRQLERP